MSGDNVTGGELEATYPLVRNKLNNFLSAIAGRPPANDDETAQSYGMLQDIFGVDFDQATKHYINYTKSNPLKKMLTNMVMQHVVGSQSDDYIKNVLPPRLDAWDKILPSEGDGIPDVSEGTKYQRKIVDGIRNVMQNNALGSQAVKHLMDFRTLDKPVPFVQSKINWLPPTQQSVPTNPWQNQ